MKNLVFITLAFLIFVTGAAQAQKAPKTHPDTSKKGWVDLFKPDLSNAIYPQGVWSVRDGVFTATEDEALWSEKTYLNFELDLEFMNAEGTNSGVIVHASDLKNWIPNSVEIQIADDYAEQWAKAPANWQNGAVFGHQPATKKGVKKPGEWNRYTVTCRDKMIWVVLNGELVNTVDMSRYTSAKTNPDGTEIPNWLNKPLASLPLEGHIGFQGKHAGAPIYLRNIKIRELK